MSLSEISLGSLVKKQFQYKLKSYIGLFSSLVVLQLVALLFSLNGTGMMGSGSFGIGIDIYFYSSDIVLVFTMLWAFICAILITTKAYREDDFAFVTTRLSNNLSNILFLLTASIIGAITAIFSGFLLRVMIYFLFDRQIVNTALSPDFGELTMGVIAAILFIFLSGSIGYLAGSIGQLNKIFVVLLPVLFIGALFLVGFSESDIILQIGDFYFFETSFLLVVLKTLASAGILFLGAVMISNRQEVRR